MFASLYKWIAIIVIFVIFLGGIGAYIWYTTDKISGLSQQITALQGQAKSLQTANDAMRTDIDNVTKLQNATNTQLNQIASQAAANEQQIQNQVLNSSDPTILQQNVMAREQALIKALQGLSQP